MTARRDYGPVQLATYLGLEQWQFSRARMAGLIPAPNRARGRWSSVVADDALARVDQIRAAAGSVPDLGAVRAAEVLSVRLGTVVTGNGVAELARRGLIPISDYYKGYPLYDGQALEAFADVAAAAIEATWAGHLRTADESAAYLRVRRSDLDHLVRAGLLAPTSWGHGPFDRRDTFSVPLYRTGDLEDLAARPDIDWAAVRAVRTGRRSLLVGLPTASASSRLERTRPMPVARSSWKHEITIVIDEAELGRVTDECLAVWWHVAQANPADGFASATPGNLAETIGREIIRRWLTGVRPELWNHQGRHYYWHELTKWRDGESASTPHIPADPADTEANDPEGDAGHGGAS